MKYLAYIMIILSLAYLTIYNGYTKADGDSEIGFHITDVAVNRFNCNLSFGVNDNGTEKIVVTDDSLDEIIRFPIMYVPIEYSFSRNGLKMYVGVWDIANQSIITGKLIIYDCSNWSTINNIALPHYPVEFYVPNDNSIVYVTCGISDEGKIKLLKVNTELYGGIVSRTDFGAAPAKGIVMNHEETKLYVYDGQLYGTYDRNWEPIETHYELKVFSPDNLAEIKSIELQYGRVLEMIKGPVGYILIAHGTPFNDRPASLTVWDTENDVVDRDICIPNLIGCRRLAYDPSRNYVYAICLEELEYYDPELDWSYPKGFTLNKIAVIALSDDSISWTSEFPERVGDIALSPDYSRLYTVTALPESQKVFYLDL